MSGNPQTLTSSNRILSHLAPGDIGLLSPHLRPVELPVRFPLERRNRPIDYIYFIESGVASVVVNGVDGRGVEVGLIGREGMTGLAVIMATDRTPHETFMQLPGAGQRLDAASLREAMEQSAGLRHAFLRYGYAFFVQTAHTAMANGRSKIEERLARWLLMAHDRVDCDELTLTHEFLALMLGVRRPGVTIALNLLEKSALIRAERKPNFSDCSGNRARALFDFGQSSQLTEFALGVEIISMRTMGRNPIFSGVLRQR